MENLAAGRMWVYDTVCELTLRVGGDRSRSDTTTIAVLFQTVSYTRDANVF